MDKYKLMKIIGIVAVLAIILGLFVIFNTESGEHKQAQSSSESDYRPEADIIVSPDHSQHNQASQSSTAEPKTDAQTPVSSHSPSPSPSPEPTEAPSLLTGASLNGTSQLDQRTELAEGFYYETISDNLRNYMTGVSYPSSEGDNSIANPAITFEELRYVHILHYDFDGNPTEGELVCNEYIAQDLVEIFYELYLNEYPLERVLLIDEYGGDDVASMEDNNTSCFNYRVVAGSTSLSKHALGLALDINPLYNPYITYEKDGTENVSPAAAYTYADRSADFPYKIDENDLCYKLFTQHGFIWGGNWNSVKDYQHFQKTLP